jgi:hypothetical protein
MKGKPTMEINLQSTVACGIHIGLICGVKAAVALTERDRTGGLTLKRFQFIVFRAPE